MIFVAVREQDFEVTDLHDFFVVEAVRIAITFDRVKILRNNKSPSEVMPSPKIRRNRSLSPRSKDEAEAVNCGCRRTRLSLSFSFFVLQFFKHSAQGSASVTDGIFLLLRCLCKRLFELVRIEKRVVSEAFVSALFAQNLTFNASF